jgi:D-threo-aldose 1-dehydrogenase
LGLGTAPLGNLYTRVTEDDAFATLAAATDQGIRWFDVAPLYGYGLAEERLGIFLRNSKPADVIVSTKVGRVLKRTAGLPIHEHFVDPLPYQPTFDYSQAGIEHSYDESLKRLQLERAQLLLLHDIDRITHPGRHRAVVKQVLDEALPTLQRLKAEKRVEAIGLGINEWDVGFEILASAEIDCVLLAGRYTLLDATALTSGFLDACARRHVSVLAAGVFNSGFLAGGPHYGYRLADEALIERRHRLTAICGRHEVPLPAAAVQFSADHPAVGSVLIGARTPTEVDELDRWRRTSIPQALWDEMHAAGLIPDGAPVLTRHERGPRACA